jgi:hypothetical protein
VQAAPSDAADPEAATVAPFGAQLAQINSGAVADRAALQLAELVRAVMATGKKGALTLKLVVTPYKGNAATVEVAATTTLALPAGDPHAGVFYTDPAGGLHRNDPTQAELALGIVDSPRPGAERPIR